MGLINQLRVLERAIQIHGKEADLLRAAEGPYGSPGRPAPVCTLRGIYHTSHNYLLMPAQDRGKLPECNEPMFLILYSEIVQLNDLVRLDGKVYKATGIADPGGLHLCTDLSLKEV